MKLIVGLGNPGREYKNTRHNIGFHIVDEFVDKNKIKPERANCNAALAAGRISNRKILVAKPVTYMNLVGGSIRKLVAKNKVAACDLLVIFDDADLDFGRIRLRPGGGDGGHKGLRSIITEIGTDQFSRLRIGIGRTGSKRLSDYVLSKFKKAEFEKLEDITDISCEAIRAWVKEGIGSVMNRYNSYKTE